MKVVPTSPPVPVAQVSAPSAKHFIDSLIRIKNSSPKDLEQTTKALQNLIRKGLRFKAGHPGVQEAFAAIFVCADRSEDKLMRKAFLNAFDGMNFSQQEGFLTAGYLYNSLYFSSFAKCVEVVAVMDEIRPSKWDPNFKKKIGKAA